MISCTYLHMYVYYPLVLSLSSLIILRSRWEVSRLRYVDFWKLGKFLTNLIWKPGSHLLPLFTQLVFLLLHTFHFPRMKTGQQNIHYRKKNADHAKINCAKIEQPKIFPNLLKSNFNSGKMEGRKKLAKCAPTLLSVMQLYPVKGYKNREYLFSTIACNHFIRIKLKKPIWKTRNWLLF